MKPYKKAQTFKLEGLLDRRRRLTDQDKEKIRELYATGKYGHRPLARMFNVSRSLIRIVVDPDCAKRVKDRIKAHWKDYAKKRTKEIHAAAIRSVRNYKYGLYKAGTIGEEQEKEKNAPEKNRADELPSAPPVGR